MGSRSTPLFASQLQGARSQQVNRHKAIRSTSPTTLSAPPVAACHHQRAHFPWLLLHHPHAVLDRRVLPSFDEPLRFRDGSLISA